MSSQHARGADPRPPDGTAHLAPLLAQARFREVVAVVAGGEEPSVWERLHALDASVRMEASSLAEIEAMATSVARSTSARELGPWIEALRAEHLLWRADLGAVPIAAPLLDRLPTDPLVPFHLLVPRARVRRIMGIAAVLLAQRARSAELFAGAEADFTRAGWAAERSMTMSLHAVVHVGVFMDDFELMGAVAAEAVADLEALESPLVDEALLGAALVAFASGDLSRMWELLDRLGRRQDVGGLPARCAEVLRRFTRLLGSGARGAEVAALDDALAELRLRYPQPARMLAVTAAHVACDLGEPARARAWGDLAEHGTEEGLLGTRDRDALALRLRLLAGDTTAVDASVRFLEGLRREGLDRDSSMKAARFATDCRRRGHTDAAGTLEEWSRRGRPPATRLTVWEAWWTDRAGVDPPPATGTEVAVRLLDTHAAVVVDGTTRRLKGSTARLLAVLVAAEGKVGTEALIDRLWPDAGPEAGRNRLNVTLHRLRRTLGSGRQVILRSGSAVWLAPPRGWWVDTWEFRRLAAGGPADRRAALELYRDHLCSQQLSYDDAVTGERLLLEARLARLLGQLTEDPQADAVMLAERALRLGVHDPVVVDALADRLVAEGHEALARRLRDAG